MMTTYRGRAVMVVMNRVRIIGLSPAVSLVHFGLMALRLNHMGRDFAMAAFFHKHGDLVKKDYDG